MKETQNILILEHNQCVGCRACELSCPKNCITLTPNTEGFFYPLVDESVCINCGVCKNHCPILSHKDTNTDKQLSYAAWLKNEELLAQSSSGGAFTAFAEKILEENGIVFGAAYDENLQVSQIYVNNKRELNRLKGSKYVVSSTGDSYIKVQEFLKTGKKVLYTGTPCQIAGLKAFLGKDFDNLYTIDLICHGTPSQKLFDKYLLWLGKRFGGKIIYYGFRDKDIGGWSCGGKIKVKTKTKTKTIEASLDPYYSSFLKFDTYRESCYSCKFSSMNRIGDITIGDYFEGKDFYPQLAGINGVSLCIVNTEKGKSLFDLVNQNLSFIPISEDSYVNVKGNLKKPSPRGKRRDFIYTGIDQLSEKKFFKKFSETHFVYLAMFRMKKIARLIIPVTIKRKIKKILRQNNG